jgi:hypothetical protein
MEPIVRELIIGAPEGNPSFGTFTYSRRFMEDPIVEGVFVFTLYFSSPYPNQFHINKRSRKLNVYLKGLSYYHQLINTPDSRFQNWRMIIYTDNETLNYLKYETQTNVGPMLVNDEKVDVVVVKWPYYSESDDAYSLRHDVLRAMRLRALFDFNHIPVFIRDADTIWVYYKFDEMGRLENKRLQYPFEIVNKWETNFLEGALKVQHDTSPAGSPERGIFFFASDIYYHRHWHKNKRSERLAPLGTFAGFVNVLPSVECLRTYDLWNDCVKYILTVSSITHIKKGEKYYSNDGVSEKIGKDEQLLTFIILPACREQMFFFELDIDKKLQGEYGYRVKNEVRNSPNDRSPFKTFYDSNYPSVVLSRGSNERIQQVINLFLRGNNATAVERRTKYELEAKRKLNNVMRRKGEATRRFKINDDTLQLSKFHYGIYISKFSTIVAELGIKNLEYSFLGLSFAYKQFEKEKYELGMLYLEEESDDLVRKKKEELKISITNLKNAILEFGDTFYTLVPEETIKKIAKDFLVQEFLEIYKQFREERNLLGGRRRKTYKKRSKV